MSCKINALLFCRVALIYGVAGKPNIKSAIAGLQNYVILCYICYWFDNLADSICMVILVLPEAALIKINRQISWLMVGFNAECRAMPRPGSAKPKAKQAPKSRSRTFLGIPYANDADVPRRPPHGPPCGPPPATPVVNHPPLAGPTDRPPPVPECQQYIIGPPSWFVSSRMKKLFGLVVLFWPPRTNGELGAESNTLCHVLLWD